MQKLLLLLLLQLMPQLPVLAVVVMPDAASVMTLRNAKHEVDSTTQLLQVFV